MMFFFNTYFFGIAAGVFSIAAFVPYIREIIQGRTRPSGPSWWTWAFVTSIMTASSWFAGAPWQVLVLPLWLSFSQFAVALLSLKHGHNIWDIWNKISIAGACASVGLWLITGNPLVALTVSIVADILASIPNFRHIWDNPEEESRLGWALGFGSAVLEIFAVNQWSFAESGFAVYFLLNMAATLFLVLMPDFKNIFIRNV